MTRAHTTTQTMQHCEVQRVPCVCPAMYNTEHIIQHTLQRRRSRLQHIAVFSFLGPHCTEAPAVRKQSVCFVCVRQCVCVWCVWLCMWACGRQDTEGFKRFVYRACVCVCVRWCKAAKNYMHVGWTVCLSVCVCVAGVRLGHTVGWLMSSHCHAHILHRGGFR